MPKLLHESQGLRIVQNDINRFVVVTLHYTADPAKRSEEWKREAMAGMIPAKWAKEYEIDYSALFGEKVFPQLSSHRHAIVVPDETEIPEHLPCWGGFDYGARNPASFHVYTILDGVTYSMWELYEPCKNIPEFVQKMKECPYWSRIRYIATDPSIWYKNQQSIAGGLTSIYSKFAECGVGNLVRGNHDEAAWLAIMKEHWADPENPTFKIFARCGNQIREMDSAVYTTQSEKQSMTQNYREDIVDHNNHSMDDCKYFMNSQPKQQHRTVRWPTMEKRWCK